jgi:hypothetical protein
MPHPARFERRKQNWWLPTGLAKVLRVPAANTAAHPANAEHPVSA